MKQKRSKSPLPIYFLEKSYSSLSFLLFRLLPTGLPFVFSSSLYNGEYFQHEHLATFISSPSCAQTFTYNCIYSVYPWSTPYLLTHPHARLHYLPKI